VCESESDSENEDHGEVLLGMYTPDIPLDSNGRPLDARHNLSEAQANAPRAQAAQSLRHTARAPAAGPSESTTQSPIKGKLASDPTVSKEPPKSEHPMATKRQVKSNGKGQESPTPTVPETEASRAGGLRPAAGSGKKGTRVTKGHPPKT
jgi:hypothetical protein